MGSIKSFVEWMTNRSFRIFLIFILFYIWWFLLTPCDPRPVEPYDHVYLRRFTYANGNYLFGLILLGLYGASSAFTRITKSHGCGGVFSHLITIFFLVINGWYTAWALPRIDDAAIHNSTMYLVVHYPTWPDRPYTLHQFTKWDWFFKYHSDEVYVDSRPHLRYDKNLQQMNVVRVFPLGYERLIYSDSEPPRYYDYGEVDFEGKRYYPSSVCNPDRKDTYLCETYTHTVYQCELDNTLCAPLPFHYIGDYSFWMYVERGNAADEIDFYFDIGDYPGVKILIFTYGERPRCYIEGCEILETP